MGNILQTKFSNTFSLMEFFYLYQYFTATWPWGSNWQEVSIVSVNDADQRRCSYSSMPYLNSGLAKALKLTDNYTPLFYVDMVI